MIIILNKKRAAIPPSIIPFTLREGIMFFLNLMLQVLRNMGKDKNRTLTLEFFQYLNYCLRFLKPFDGTIFFNHRSVKALTELDVCITGKDGRWNNEKYKLSIPQDYDITPLHISRLSQGSGEPVVHT